MQVKEKSRNGSRLNELQHVILNSIFLLQRTLLGESVKLAWGLCIRWCLFPDFVVLMWVYDGMSVFGGNTYCCIWGDASDWQFFLKWSRKKSSLHQWYAGVHYIYIFPLMHSVTSRWQLEIGCGGSVYTLEISKCYNSGLFFCTGELTVGH